MHELALVRSIYNVIDEKIREYGIKKVVLVKIVAGEMTGIEDSIMKGCFEVYVQSTQVEGARLVIEHVPIKVKCRDCGSEYETRIPFEECPACKSKNFSIIGGKEFYIDSIEAE